MNVHHSSRIWGEEVQELQGEQRGLDGRDVSEDDVVDIMHHALHPYAQACIEYSTEVS